MKTPRTQRRLISRLLTSSALIFATSSAWVHGNTLELAPETVSLSSTTTMATNRIIVKYKSSNTLSAQSTVSASAMSRVSTMAGGKAKHMRRLSTGAHLIKLERQLSAGQMNELLEEMNADPNVLYAEPDTRVTTMFTPNDTRYNEQWHYFEPTGGLNLPTAWDEATGEGVVVGVLDTGILPHADLTANLLPGYDMITDPQVAQDGNGRDSDASDEGDWSNAGECDPQAGARNSSWHGTHVAGTIAAQTNNGTGIAGVAFESKIVPIRVLGRCGGFISDIADGLIWGAGGNVDGAPANANPAQVLNLSLGGGGDCSTTMQQAINTARGLGATVVVAAGNDNINASNATPANCDGVITVASTNRSGGRAFYSNFGAAVDLAAPGGATNTGAADGVLSTLNSGTRGPGSDTYAFYQGTSMATPHVAGVAALMYQVNPDITPSQVESILKDTTRSFPSTCSQCGTGIVDAAAAVTVAGGGSVPTPTPTPPPSGDSLENGVAKRSLSGARGEETFFTLEVPAGATDLSFAVSGGSGDVDLYVRYGSAPTTSTYDCRPFLTGNSETCAIDNVQSGTYYVMLRGYAAYSGVTLIANYSEAGTEPTPDNSIVETNLSGNRNAWQHFSIEVPAGSLTLNASISGGSGDADLFVRYGSQPTSSTYECRPYLNGNEESCTIDDPQAGTWWVSLRGYQNYSGVTLEASSN